MINTSFLDNHDLILTTHPVINGLPGENGNKSQPCLAGTMLVNDKAGQQFLANYYRNFIAVARRTDVPIFLGSPTGHANRESLTAANINHNINALAVRFLKYLRAEYNSWSENIFIAGQVNCKNSCFRADQALSSRESVAFHAWQINKLDKEGVDLLVASQLPSLQEAIGIATAMAVTATPYVISFLLDKNGQLPDGTSLVEAFDEIDSLGLKPPVGYMVSCSDPSHLNIPQQPDIVMERLIGVQAWPSTCPGAIENLPALDMKTWCRKMMFLNQHYSVNIMGDYPGTKTKYLQNLVAQLATAKENTILRCASL